MLLRTAKNTAAYLISLAMFAGLGVSAASANEIESKKVNVHYVPLSFSVEEQVIRPHAGESGFILEGTTYVPLRFMANALEKHVVWDGATSTVAVSEPTEVERFAIREQNTAYAAASAEQTPVESAVQSIQVFQRPVMYEFDGKRTEPEAGKQGFIYNDRLYVPFRFMGESLGRKVDWNQETYTISVLRAAASAVDAKEPAKSETPTGSPAVEQLVPPPSGGSRGGGGGSGGSSKPSYNSLTSDAEDQMAELRDRCESQLTPLAEEFLNSEGEGSSFDLLAEGQDILEQCDSDFDDIVDKLKADLERYGYDTSITDDYRIEYERIKREQIQNILTQL